MDGQLRIQVSEDGADAARLDAVTGYLRQDLVQLDVDDVTTLAAGPPPPGARAVSITAVGGLLVALGGSVDILRSVVGAVQAWLGRGSGARRTIRLELGGDALELSQASAADQERLIGLFISRHSEPPSGLPSELSASELPASELPPSGPPSELPPSELPPSEVPSGEVPASELPAGELPPPP